MPILTLNYNKQVSKKQARGKIVPSQDEGGSEQHLFFCLWFVELQKN
jgi:hypothetical protein